MIKDCFHKMPANRPILAEMRRELEEELQRVDPVPAAAADPLPLVLPMATQQEAAAAEARAATLTEASPAVTRSRVRIVVDVKRFKLMPDSAYHDCAHII